MSCVFLTLPPFPTQSRLRRDAKFVARQGGKSYQACLEQVVHRQIKELPRGDLGGEYVAHLRENGWLTFLFHGFGVSVITEEHGTVADNLVSPPVGVSIVPDLMGFDGDPFIPDFKPTLMLCLVFENEEEESPFPVHPLDWSVADSEAMTDTARPLRERLGTLIKGLRDKLTEMTEQPRGVEGIRFVAGGELTRRAHREAAHDVRECLGYDMCRFEIDHRFVFEMLFLAATPACAELWRRRAAYASSTEERIDVLRCGVEICSEVFGPFPVEIFVTEDDFPDWKNVVDYLELREMLVSILSDNGKKKEALSWRNGLHAEIRRVKSLAETLPDDLQETKPT